MADSRPSAAGSGPGRPSLAADRRHQVLDAFIGLIARRGLEDVTLDDVARGAGVQRSVVRHYVGNRQDLIGAAVEVLVDRYQASIRTALGAQPSLEDLLGYLFSPSWTAGLPAEGRALDVLLQEAARSDSTRQRVLRAYQLLVGEVAAAIGRKHPDLGPETLEDGAYQVVCLAEFNATLQTLGFSSARSAGARAAAADIVTWAAARAAERTTNVASPPRKTRRDP